MSSKCSVANCHFKSSVCFHSPQSRPHLELWKKILNINVDQFYVCDKHFEDKFFRIDKRLTFDAFPTQYISNIEEGSGDYCQCCMKSFVRSKFITQYEPRIKIDGKVQQDFADVIGFEIPTGVICQKCFDSIKNFMKFRSDVREKQKIRDEIFKLRAQQESQLQIDQNIRIKDEPRDPDVIEPIVNIHEELISDPATVQIKDEPTDENLVIKEEKIDLGGDGHFLVSEIKTEPEEMQHDSGLKPRVVRISQAVPKQKIIIKRSTGGVVVRPSNIQNFRVVQPTNVVRVVKQIVKPQNVTSQQVQQPQVESPTDNLGYKCQYCPNRFIERRFVVEHIKQKHTFQCDQCSSVFPFKITLIKHQMSLHGSSSGSPTAKYKHICRICGLKFLSKFTLDTHMMEKHQRALIEEKINTEENNDNIIIIRPINLPSKPSTSGPSTSFRKIQKIATNQCQQALSNQIPIKSEDIKPVIKIETQQPTIIKKPVTTLVRKILNPVATPKHKKAELIVEDPDGIPCLDCGLLLRPDKLLKHRMDAHDLNTHNMYYTCDLCGTEIKGKTQLINHMTTKHLCDNFKRCEYCDGLFETLTDVICHQNLQHNFNGTRYTCHFCYQVFGSKREMILHRKAHYSEKESRSKLARVFCKKFKSYEPKGADY